MKKMMIAFAVALAVLLLPSCFPHEKTFAKWADTLSWTSHSPILVFDAAEVRWVDEAIKDWNRCGCQVFRRTYDRSHADIVIVRVDEIPSRLKRRPTKAIGRLAAGEGKIYIKGYNESGIEYAIVLHELGHALGLSHDYRRRLSIMSPGSYRYYSNENFKLPLPFISHSDRNAIKNKFCNGN